jgi:DNA-binding beta-propeller fold protein YncE
MAYMSCRSWIAGGRSVCLIALFGTHGICIGADPNVRFDVVADVPLPGDTSRFDYESLDPTRHLLFIAHLGASEVLAFDTDQRRVVARMANISRVHGVLVVPELRRVYASATGTNEVVVIDEDTFKISARMPGGRYPDGIAYAPQVHKLYVSDETGKTETVIDTNSNQRVATIELGGEVGNTQYDSISKHIFVNVQSRADLVEIDPASDKILARIPLPGAEGNHGLLIDAERRRAFIACEGNDKLLVLNFDSRKVESSFQVGSGPDVLAKDDALARVYVASESGTVSVFESGRDVLKVFEGFLGPNAHVVTIDSVQHLGYFALKDSNGSPVLRIVHLKP